MVRRPLWLCAFGVLLGMAAQPALAQCWEACSTYCDMYNQGTCSAYRRTCEQRCGPGGSKPARTFGAIAYSPSTGGYGYSYKYGSRTEAENRAIKECGKNDCQVATWFVNNCGALAADSKGPWGGGHGNNERTAQAAAQARCAKEGGAKCEIKFTQCSQ
jgi:hypothetical protein